MLDENERDYRLGIRSIVFEEFVLSILYIPHLIAMPVKFISYVLARLHIERYFTATRRVRQDFELYFYDIDRSNIYLPTEPMVQQVVTDYTAMLGLANDFFSTQLLILMQLGLVVYGFIEAVNWVLLKLEFAVKKLMSGFVYVPLGSPNLAIALVKPRGLWILRLLQIPVAVLLAVSRVALIAAPVYLNFRYTNYTWFGCLFGPAFVNLIAYAGMILNFWTTRFYTLHLRYYTPYTTIGQALYHSIYRPCAFVFSGVMWLRAQGMRCCNSLVAKARQIWPIMQTIAGYPTALMQNYANILHSSWKLLKQRHAIGRLIFILVAIVWAGWPLAVSWYVGETWFWIGSSVFTAFLTAKGYSVANRA